MSVCVQWVLCDEKHSNTRSWAVTKSTSIHPFSAANLGPVGIGKQGSPDVLSSSASQLFLGDPDVR